MGILSGGSKTTRGGILSTAKVKPDLSTSQGLYQLATQSGLQKEAERISTSLQGEKPKEFFSGGFISDIFDAINTLQYGVVGTLQGKGFWKGVKTRASWSDKDYLGDKGLPGIIGGIALDIACDPFTYIAPWTVLKKVPGIAKAVDIAGETAKATKIGKWFGRKFVYMFGADPMFKEMYERSIKNIAVGGKNIGKMISGISDLAPETAKKLLTRDETGRFIRVGLDKLKGVLTDSEMFNVAKAYSVLDDLGGEAVKLGRLSKGKWEQNLGEYIKNAYLEYEQRKGGKGIFGFMKLGVKGIKKRVKGLTPEKMAELGQIENPAYLLWKSTFDLMKDNENAKLFNTVAKNFGVEALQKGFKQLPTGTRLGKLAGKFVPENVFDYIQEIQKPITKGIEKKIVGNFKFAKVILNPATHARNSVSNTILNWWKLGIGPWRIDKYAEGLSDITTKSKWFKRFENAGGGTSTMVSNEIMSLIDGPEMNTIGKKVGGLWGKIKDKLGKVYQGEENIAKIVAFKEMIKKGMTDDVALKMAESATFNYSQVTPFVRQLRESLWGFPFITFSIKAAPLALETAVKAPHRISIFGKIKNSIENAADIETTERERASEPPWIKDGFYIKLPIKDKHGRSAYFDLTYILPFGDLISGQFFGRQTKRKTGLPESVPEALIGKSPFFGFIKDISRNQDFYGDRIWKESDNIDQQLKDLFRYTTKVYAPPLVADQVPGGYKKSGERRYKGFKGVLTASKENQQRNLFQEVSRHFGMKVQPVNVDIQESYAEWNRKKALETLLQEQGILKEFKRSYVPKE